MQGLEFFVSVILVVEADHKHHSVCGEVFWTLVIRTYYVLYAWKIYAAIEIFTYITIAPT